MHLAMCSFYLMKCAFAQECAKNLGPENRPEKDNNAQPMSPYKPPLQPKSTSTLIAMAVIDYLRRCG